MPEQQLLGGDHRLRALPGRQLPAGRDLRKTSAIPVEAVVAKYLINEQSEM